MLQLLLPAVLLLHKVSLHRGLLLAPLALVLRTLLLLRLQLLLKRLLLTRELFQLLQLVLLLLRLILQLRNPRVLQKGRRPQTCAWRSRAALRGLQTAV